MRFHLKFTWSIRRTKSLQPTQTSARASAPAGSDSSCLRCGMSATEPLRWSMRVRGNMAVWPHSSSWAYMRHEPLSSSLKHVFSRFHRLVSRLAFLSIPISSKTKKIGHGHIVLVYSQKTRKGRKKGLVTCLPVVFDWFVYPNFFFLVLAKIGTRNVYGLLQPEHGNWHHRKNGRWTFCPTRNARNAFFFSCTYVDDTQVGISLTVCNKKRKQSRSLVLPSRLLTGRLEESI